MDKVSYAIGMNIAANLKQSGVQEVDCQSVADGLRAVFEGKPTEISAQEAGQILNKFFVEVEEKLNARNIEEGAAFLAGNGEREGVIKLASGLQYEILKSGNGPRPKATDKVKCHYHGTLINGTVFDSSVQRGEPAIFPVNGVIQGWVEALQMMPVGSKWKLFIPSNLAYGARGAGNSIAPHSTLIFEVELLEIVK